MLIESKGGCSPTNVHKTARSEDKDPGNYYSCSDIINLFQSTVEPTQGAIALTLARMGLRVFPCKIDKSPVTDYSLGFTKGFIDAITDKNRIIRTWKIYRDAAIGLAIPPWMKVFDLDVNKDQNKRPILNEEGLPDYEGLRSFQKLIFELGLDLNNPGGALDTLMVTTQSGGLQIFYRLPEGYCSFNRTGILPRMDVKGYGGYVIMPNSSGLYGHYKFKNLSHIRPIPDALFDWLFKSRGVSRKESKVTDFQEVNDSRVTNFVHEILPSWNLALEKHMGNEMRLAIAGTLYHFGWPESKAQQVMKMIIEGSTVPGSSDKNAVHYTYANGRAGKPVYGFSHLKKLIAELEGNKND